MSWWTGTYQNDRDATDANTISDTDWRDLQGRAGRAQPNRRIDTDEGRAGIERGAENYRSRWWN